MPKTPEYQRKAAKRYYGSLAAKGKVVYRRVVKKETVVMLDKILASIKTQDKGE